MNWEAWRANPLRPTNSWVTERHLRNGFFLGLPLFFIGFAAVLVSRASAWGWVAMAICAILSNLVWLGDAAYARSKDQPPI
jgi:hypothetical protein